MSNELYIQCLMSPYRNGRLAAMADLFFKQTVNQLIGLYFADTFERAASADILRR